MDKLLKKIKRCQLCKESLPNAPNPVLAAHAESKIAIIGQAPGRVVHESGVPWNDKSGDRLRSWLGVDVDCFYDPSIFALVPMGFCYPGTGKSGDLPPRKECAPEWHKPLFKQMPNIKLTLLIGNYAQAYYLNKSRKKNLTETVMHFEEYLPRYFVMPLPSPRNNIWIKKNPWFEDHAVSVLQAKVSKLIG